MQRRGMDRRWVAMDSTHRRGRMPQNESAGMIDQRQLGAVGSTRAPNENRTFWATRRWFAVAGWLGERPDAGDVAPDDQGLHCLGAFVRVDDLYVAHVADDVVLQQDAVAA
jgi:hypothetical protein